MTPWTVARQASLSIEFFKQNYWSGLPFPPPGDLPHPEIEPGFPALHSFLSEPPGKPRFLYLHGIFARHFLTHLSFLKEHSWGSISRLGPLMLLTSYVTLGKSLHFSDLQSIKWEE